MDARKDNIEAEAHLLATEEGRRQFVAQVNQINRALDMMGANVKQTPEGVAAYERKFPSKPPPEPHNFTREEFCGGRVIWLHGPDEDAMNHQAVYEFRKKHGDFGGYRSDFVFPNFNPGIASEYKRLCDVMSYVDKFYGDKSYADIFNIQLWLITTRTPREVMEGYEAGKMLFGEQISSQ